MKMPLAIFACFAVALAITCFEGCTPSQSTTAFQASSTGDAAVRTAMTSWGLYVAAKHPSTNAETQVLIAFNAVKNAELAVIDAETQLSTNAAASNQVSSAGIILQNAQSFLLQTISTITNAP